MLLGGVKCVVHICFFFFVFFCIFFFLLFLFFFFFQAEDGIRDRSPSRGLGDVYKRQSHRSAVSQPAYSAWIRYLSYPYTFSGPPEALGSSSEITSRTSAVYKLSLIHI